VKLASLVLLLALSGCAAARAPGGSAPAPRPIDTLCLDDCLGTGGTHEFCEDRCSD
jgi:hypothetical protein